MVQTSVQYEKKKYFRLAEFTPRFAIGHKELKQAMCILAKTLAVA